MTLSSDQEKPGTVKSDRRLLEILLGLKELDGAGVTELAEHLDLAKSTVHNHLSTLHDAKFVTKDGTEYHLGLRFLDLGEAARLHRTESDRIKRKVDSLADQTEERAQFIVEEHGFGVYLYRSRGEKAVSTDSRIGRHIPIHATAAGKAILANLPEERTQAILDDVELSPLTEHTITDYDELMEELETIRERGYATNIEESTTGLRAVGAPITRPDGSVVGAISISGPTHRLKGEIFEQEFPDLVMGATNEIELNISFS
jgi:DNA-binding IclR family transcriptional regulator